MILIAVLIIFNLLRKMYFLRHLKYIYNIFGAVFALDHSNYVHVCNQKRNVLPQASKRLLKITIFLLINITLAKNPHAYFLRPTFTKREQFRTEHHYLKSGFF
jgi:hypothetical protein